MRWGSAAYFFCSRCNFESSVKSFALAPSHFIHILYLDSPEAFLSAEKISKINSKMVKTITDLQVCAF